MEQLISICIATYNGAEYIREQLDSIVNQTYQNFEVIIQDDCSSDNTLEIVKEYEDKINITIYKNEENLGYIKNFESVTKKANGDLIALCDQDDVWEKDKLELLVHNISDTTLIYSDSLLVDQNAQSLHLRFSHSLKNNFVSTKNPLTFINDNCVSAHAMLFKKELLEIIFPFPQNVFFDAWIAANAASLNGVVYLDKCLVNYRQHSTNTLSKHNKSSKKERPISTKAQKKLSNIQAKIEVIDTFLGMKNLDQDDINLLKELKNEYQKFENSWYNRKLNKLLIDNKHKLYEITTKNTKRLALKDAIGYKLYKALPIL
jgi:glycosyltransferase involved in cell wall biosynthesis